MGKQTEIEWCDATWNPWYGCRKVSAGCKFCYAEREMTRYGRDFGAVTRAKDATFRAPLKWKEPKRIFTCSWSDWFIKEADPWRAEAWNIIERPPQHTYLILTKRVERIMSPNANHRLPWAPWEKPWPNVWLGVSVENQEQADKRIPILLQIPAALHFVSYEPALGPIDLRSYLAIERLGDLAIEKSPDHKITRSLNWVIVGGESGRTARPFEVGWAFDVLDQCKAAGVPCFVKQMGSRVRVSQETLNRRFGGTMSFNTYDQVAEQFVITLDHNKGADMSEWPGALRVREWPKAEEVGSRETEN